MATPQKKETDSVSVNTKDRAQAAKQYIESKYSKLRLQETERKRNWENLNKKMKELRLDREEKKLIKQEILHRESDQMRAKRTKMTVYDFTSIKIVGKGAFGEVRVVRYKPTGEIFALKKMNKNELLCKNQIQHVRTERDILTQENPWVVELNYSFQDYKYLYLVMEYLAGGDLMTLLMNKNTITEAESRFYIAEVVAAVESIHKANYIHRDLKPDNILIDNDGHIKLSDFGLSKEAQIYPSGESLDKLKSDFKSCGAQKRNRKLAYSTVGTPDYIAPEIFDRTGYSESVDWWSVGVILYEMLVGYPPFYAEQPADVCHKIMQWRKHFTIPSDAGLSRAAKDLIKKLICRPHERISAEEIKEHSFFAGVNWEDLKAAKPPFVPQISSPVDTRNFDDFEETESFYPPKFPKTARPRKDINFVGYTFKGETDRQKTGLETAIEELDFLSKRHYVPSSSEFYA